MNITIPFADLYEEAQKLKDKVAPQGRGFLSDLKDKPVRMALEGLSFSGVSNDTLRMAVALLKVDLCVVNVEKNDIVIAADAKMLDKALDLFHINLGSYVERLGDGKFKVLLGSNPKLAQVFEWVELKSICFDEENVLIEASPVRQNN